MERHWNRSVMIFILLLILGWQSPVEICAAADKLVKANASFDASKISDMSGFDPATWVSPTGDTIRIGIVASFSGPAQISGMMYWSTVASVAYDINKRGGILVDGKKKLVEVIKGDSMGRIDEAKKAAERMILHNKVHVIWGTDGSHISRVLNGVCNRYKVISMNTTTTPDDLQNAEYFGRYSFQTCFSADQTARGIAYFYGKIRKKEKKFYILCQDYAYGHNIAESFKRGLKLYFPEAQIVGEDYHKLFLTDYAPYLTKIKASGAEVIFSADWSPDAGNLAKQARQMGVNLPFANLWMNEPNMLHDLGPEGAKDWVHVGPYHSPVPFDSVPGFITYFNIVHDAWKQFRTPPYNSRSFEHGAVGIGGSWRMQTYWLLSVIERAKTTNPEKIIELWEGDTYRQANGKIMLMRACDHKVVQDLSAEVYGPPEEQKASFTIAPYYWYKGASYTARIYRLPAERVLPWMDRKLERCKGKNDWGE